MQFSSTHNFSLMIYPMDRDGDGETVEYFGSKKEFLEALKARDELAYNDYVNREMAYGMYGTYQIQFLY